MSAVLSRPARLAALVLAALSTGGCALHVTHHCTVPPPVVEAAPGRKLPLSVAVRTSTPASPGASEHYEQRDPVQRWGVDPLPPSQAMFDRLAASIFGGVTAPDAPPDAVLDVRVEGMRFAWTPIGFTPYSATVAYQVALRAPDGAEVAVFDLAGEGARGAVYDALTHCKGIGDAVALAMQDAGGKLVARLGSDPAVAAWLGARGISVPTLAVRPTADYVELAPAAPPVAAEPAYEPYAPPGMTLPGAAAPPVLAAGPPRPISAPAPGPPTAPRAYQFRVGLGMFLADESAGRLESPSTGVAFTILGVEWRPRPPVGVTFEFGSLWRGYSGRTLPAAGPFAVPQGISLSSTIFGIGVRGILPGGPVEPWIGATALLARTELSQNYSLFGFTGSGHQETAWSPGLDLGGGLLLYPGSRFQLGLEVRRLVSRASFSVFPGDVSIGGWSTTLTFGAALP